jgi:PAS domain S-box-containing protein
MVNLVDLSQAPAEPSAAPVSATAPLNGAKATTTGGDLFRHVVEAAPYGMAVVDPEGRLVVVNAHLATLFGYQPGELVGQPVDSLLPERYRAAHPVHRQRYQGAPARRGMAVGRDLTGQHRDGREFPVEVALSPLPWNGTMMSLAVVIDLSARKSLELRLREAHARLEEFNDVTSHDLKAPLRGISDLVTWIVADLGPGVSGSAGRNLQRVQHRARRMEQIIDDLLSYARAGRAASELVTIDAERLIRDVLELLPIPARFEITVSCSVATFPALRTPLEVTMRNLVANACQHHDRPDGKVGISAAEDGSYCLFTVSDDGPGVAPEARDRIFGLAQRSSPGSGMGMGLAMTRRLVEGHGGQIWVEEKAGRGATFRVLWPRFHRKDLDDR